MTKNSLMTEESGRMGDLRPAQSMLKLQLVSSAKLKIFPINRNYIIQKANKFTLSEDLSRFSSS